MSHAVEYHYRPEYQLVNSHGQAYEEHPAYHPPPQHHQVQHPHRPRTWEHGITYAIASPHPDGMLEPAQHHVVHGSPALVPTPGHEYYTYDSSPRPDMRPRQQVVYHSPYVGVDEPQFRPRAPPPRPLGPGLGGTLKVLKWTPQSGEQGTEVTIVVDAQAVHDAPPTSYSAAYFGPSTSPEQPVTRVFAVMFGPYASPTKFALTTAAAAGLAEDGRKNAARREVVALTTYVPPRRSMAVGPGERVMVRLQVIEEQTDQVVEELIVGEWDPPSRGVSTPVMAPMTPNMAQRGAMKRAGEELVSGRDAPPRRPVAIPSPAMRSYQGSPMTHSTSQPGWGMSPQIPQHSPSMQQMEQQPSPPEDHMLAAAGEKHSSTVLRHPPPAPRDERQPGLQRTTQIASNPTPASTSYAVPLTKAILHIDGDLDQMAQGWSNDEWTGRRRLVQFWRHQEGNSITARFGAIPSQDYVPTSIVVSCIFRDDKNECFVTSVDTIYLLEAFVGSTFTVEEKNRIRRNLEGFKPITVSKSKPESEPFFKLIMSFPNPKPRNIEKDVKVFPWKLLSKMLEKIVSKYSVRYPNPSSINSHSPAPESLTSKPPSPIEHIIAPIQHLSTPAASEANVVYSDSPEHFQPHVTPSRQPSVHLPSTSQAPPQMSSTPPSPIIIQQFSDDTPSLTVSMAASVGTTPAYVAKVTPPQEPLEIGTSQAMSSRPLGMTHSKNGSFDFGAFLETSSIMRPRRAQSYNEPLMGSDGFTGGLDGLEGISEEVGGLDDELRLDVPPTSYGLTRARSEGAQLPSSSMQNAFSWLSNTDTAAYSEHAGLVYAGHELTERPESRVNDPWAGYSSGHGRRSSEAGFLNIDALVPSSFGPLVPDRSPSVASGLSV